MPNVIDETAPDAWGDYAVKAEQYLVRTAHHDRYFEAMLEAGIEPTLIGSVLERVINQETNDKIQAYEMRLKNQATDRVRLMRQELENRVRRPGRKTY